MIMKKYFIIMVITIGSLLFGCSKSYYYGDSETGYKAFPKTNHISVEKAIEIASPYMDKSTALRKTLRSEQHLTSVSEKLYVLLYDQYYFIGKDSFKAKTINYYLQGAVMVNKNTGSVSLATIPYSTDK